MRQPGDRGAVQVHHGLIACIHRARRSALTTFAAAVAVVGLAGCPSAITSVRLEQINLRINAGTEAAVVVDDSGWGWLHLGYHGSLRPQYLNLAVGESWAIQNLPLVSVLGPSAEQKMSVAFGLGVAPGTRVSQLQYGVS